MAKPGCSSTIVLVSCVAGKQSSPAPAGEMYTSAWFRKARCYANLLGHPWFILSAQYGLLAPDEVIEPYELTLNRLRVKDRKAWAEKVLAQLRPRLTDVESVTFLAGQRYREFLEQSLQDRGLDVCIPMEGMRIGEQLNWLDRKLHGKSAL